MDTSVKKFLVEYSAVILEIVERFPNARPTFTQSVKTMLKTWDYVQAHEGATIEQLTTALDLHQSSVHAHLAALEAAQAAKRERTGKYPDHGGIPKTEVKLGG